MSASYINPKLPSMIRNLHKSDPSERSVQVALGLAADLIEELIDLKPLAEAAEATLERVRALHRVDQYTEGRAVTRCVCEEKWPCSTLAALAPVTEEGDK